MTIPTNSNPENSNNNKVTQVSNLDFGNPLYLHPSDTSTTSLISFKLKGTENYNIWSCAMILALETKNKIGFIDGSCQKDLEDEVLGKQWDRCNSVVLSWILGSVTEEVYLGQFFSKRASVVWQELKETYDKVDGSITFNLHHEINSLTQNGSSISEYYHKLNSLWKQFDALVKLPTCTCNAAKDFCDHNQLIKLMQFLMGLDDVYTPIRSNILTRDPLPSVKAAFAIISREESHRGTSSSTSKNKNQNSAFVAKTFDNNKKQFGPNRGPNPNLKYTKCNKIGHTIEMCYEIVGYPPGYGKKNNSQFFFSSSNSVTEAPRPNENLFPFSSDQIAKIMRLIDDKNGRVNASVASTFFNSNSFFNKNFDTFFNSNSNSFNCNNQGWIIDSGANQHMTSDLQNLDHIIDVSNLKLTVGHPNGTLAKIKKIGNLRLTNNIVLKDVLVVPEYCVNLMSVHKLAKDTNL